MSRAARPAREPLSLSQEQLSPATFGAFRDLLHRHSGIALAAHKLTMVQSRLAKRLRALGLQTYEEYLQRLEGPQSAEWPEFINALTTNLTSFFREGHHFTRLPELLITFQQLNLLDEAWPVGGEPFQAIFCRNVMIYFDKPTQRGLLRRFHGLLEPEGLLFVGHSEALLDNSLGFQSLGQTIYRRRALP